MATISLCMIAKDEEKFIANAISSVKDVVDEIVVVDTGSSDRTPEIARELGASVHYFEWNDDFSAARNFALSKVNSEWVFVLDADEEVLQEDLASLRRLPDLGADAYIFIQKNFSNTPGFGFVPEARKGLRGFFPSFIIRMFRSDSRLRYQGTVHETVDASLARLKARVSLSPVPVYHFQELKGADCFREKQLKYAEILERDIDSFPDRAKAYHDIGIAYYRFRNDYEKAVECFRRSVDENPNNAFVLNDLASAYVQLGDYKLALENYGKSLVLRPDPSVFFNIGLLQEKLGNYEAAVLSYEEAVRRGHPRKAEISDKVALLRSLMKG